MSSVKLGLWLKDVQLFRDAWELVVETAGRFVWSQPIFFITAAWSFFVAREAHRWNIAHAWAYMVLGQLVAISFAMNLFFLAVLVYRAASLSHDIQSKSKAERKKPLRGSSDTLWTPPAFIYLTITVATLLSVAFTQRSAGTPYFLHVLALPHVLLLLPPILCKVCPTRFRVLQNPTQYNRAHRLHIEILAVAVLAAESFTVWQAFQDKNVDRHLHRHSNVYPSSNDRAESPLLSIFRSLVDHPAVSSVGWDSILCVANTIAWSYD